MTGVACRIVIRGCHARALWGVFQRITHIKSVTSPTNNITKHLINQPSSACPAPTSRPRATRPASTTPRPLKHQQQKEKEKEEGTLRPCGCGRWRRCWTWCRHVLLSCLFVFRALSLSLCCVSVVWNMYLFSNAALFLKKMRVRVCLCRFVLRKPHHIHTHTRAYCAYVGGQAQQAGTLEEMGAEGAW